MVGRPKGITIAGSLPFLVLDGSVAMGPFPADYVANEPTVSPRLQVVVEALRERGLQPGPIRTAGPVDPAAEPVILGAGWTALKDNVVASLYNQ